LIDTLPATFVGAVSSSAREAGVVGALDEVERILSDGNGAARQRATHARAGIAAMLSALVTRRMDA
jgi:gamma-glutamyl:cysteine ligase YbdK (ATP-grasp superfamily)